MSVSTQNQTLGSVTADHEVKVIDILSYWAMSSLHYTVMMHRITSKNQLWWRSCNFADFHEKMNHNGLAHDKLLGYRAVGIWPHYKAQCQTNSSQKQMYCHCRRSDQKKKRKKRYDILHHEISSPLVHHPCLELQLCLSVVLLEKWITHLLKKQHKIE